MRMTYRFEILADLEKVTNLHVKFGGVDDSIFRMFFGKDLATALFMAMSSDGRMVLINGAAVGGYVSMDSEISVDYDLQFNVEGNLATISVTVDDRLYKGRDEFVKRSLQDALGEVASTLIGPPDGGRYRTRGTLYRGDNAPAAWTGAASRQAGSVSTTVKVGSQGASSENRSFPTMGCLFLVVLALVVYWLM